MDWIKYGDALALAEKKKRSRRRIKKDFFLLERHDEKKKYPDDVYWRCGRIMSLQTDSERGTG